ncbi:MAG: sulfite exporter TauE/SafE family protein [Candidatus Omnitrophica bacterium]|nr:sulfite exporter TauE/SafE family protein [Candidatus Omnitrophota bacterium]
MYNNLITCGQLFGIGISFGIAGPCLVGCSPFIAAYVLGKQSGQLKAVIDITIFLIGRLLAYLILGFLAGLSAGVLKQWSSSSLVFLLKPVGAVIIILLGMLIWLVRDPHSKICQLMNNTKLNFAGLFMAGIIIGIFPCAPLLALLFEITMISKTAAQGMFYALFFGLGSFASGLVVISSMVGVLNWIPQTIVKSKKWQLVCKAVYSVLFIAIGIGFLFAR